MSRRLLIARAGLGMAMAAAVAACAASEHAPTASGGDGPLATATLAATPAPATTPAPTPTTAEPTPAHASPLESAPPTAGGLPAEPPAASLAGAGPSPVAGALGSYTWRTTGSDAPWIVGRSATPVAGGARLTVGFAATAPSSWTASWARVADGHAGAPTGTMSGTGEVAVAAPATAGDWSLRVTAVFGTAASATYFWRLAVR